jgi:hypothetical protein
VQLSIAGHQKGRFFLKPFLWKEFAHIILDDETRSKVRVSIYIRYGLRNVIFARTIFASRGVHSIASRGFQKGVGAWALFPPKVCCIYRFTLCRGAGSMLRHEFGSQWTYTTSRRMSAHSLLFFFFFFFLIHLHNMWCSILYLLWARVCVEIWNDAGWFYQV